MNRQFRQTFYDNEIKKTTQLPRARFNGFVKMSSGKSQATVPLAAFGSISSIFKFSMSRALHPRTRQKLYYIIINIDVLLATMQI
jgi:hypothetical protein